MNIDPYIAEFIGTFILLLLGEGVVANVNLKKTIAEGQTPWVLITSAWGFSVFVAVFITSQFSGAHLNPAVTIGLAVAEKFSWTLVPGYLISQLLGAMMGSWICYITYIDHYKVTSDEDSVRSTFCTGPAIRNLKNKVLKSKVCSTQNGQPGAVLNQGFWGSGGSRNDPEPHGSILF